jgi:hypothetical protein
MVLILHIAVALLSMVASGLAYFKPSHKKLHTSYSLVAATLVSGTYLVISSHSPLLESCLTGLLYLGIVFSGIIAAHYKLASQEEN